jgi:energy-coupling factor transport system ATP-binding protein
LTVRAARRLAEVVDPGPPPLRREIRPGPVLVATSRLDAGYDDRSAVRGVGIEVRAGELIALMGRNGAGKTTLLKCLAGLHRPDSGTVDFAGGRPAAPRPRRTGGAPTAPRPGTDVALCPQEPEAVLFKDRVADEVTATLAARGGDPAEARAYLARLGLEPVAMRHPRDLSAGERLLVAVAAVAATGAPVLLLDEPTRGLDPESKRALGAFLRGHAAGGGAAVFATHDVELVADLAERVVIMAGGEVIADGTPAEVLGDSPVFAPQMGRVFGPGWLTPEGVAAALVETSGV